jgi:hypothetical protein
MITEIEKVLKDELGPHLYHPQHRDFCVPCDILCHEMQKVTIPHGLGPVRHIFPLLTFDEQQAILNGKLKTKALRALVKQKLKEISQ